MAFKALTRMYYIFVSKSTNSFFEDWHESQMTVTDKDVFANALPRES